MTNVTKVALAAFLAVGALGGCQPVDGETGPTTDVFKDDQVVGLAVVLSDHQVQVATAALARGLTFEQVRAYAGRLITEQSAARDRLLAIASSQGLQVDMSTIEAKSHITDTSEDIALIQPPVSGTQVDTVYLADSQHDVGKAIEIYDHTLLISVTNAALSAELQATRPIYVDELAAADRAMTETGIAPKVAGN